MTHQIAKVEKIRRPAVAGSFYPADRAGLLQTVRDFLKHAHSMDLPAARGLIVPHAGYVCSGIVAAAGFGSLATAQATPQATPEASVQTVYLIGPAHRMPVHGVGLSSAAAFETPLGEMGVATDEVHALLAIGNPYHLVDAAHAPEHCLEVELPFLQTVLPNARIVPMLFDEEVDPQRLAEDLARRLEDDPRSFMIVSSDLSHYLPYAQAEKLDRALLDAIANSDFVTARRGQACGIAGILALMAIGEGLSWTPHVVDYRNSGDTCGSRNEVVGYGAVVYTN